MLAHSMRFSQINDRLRTARLAPPQGRVTMVLDTDTYNEIDDQFALVCAMLSLDRLDVQAIYAAPFHNKRSDGSAEALHWCRDCPATLPSVGPMGNIR